MEIRRIKVVEKKIRACAYVRVSTKEDEQEDSFETQKRYWESKLKYDPSLDFIGIFADEGISGRKVEERTEYMKMLKLVRDGEIDRIYVKSVSRFGRNKLEALRAIQEVRDCNAEIIFEKENLSTSDPKCSFTLTVMTTFAEAESESLSRNVKWSYQKRMERGELQFCRVFGYNIVNGKPVINEEEAKWVRFIFDERVSKKKHYSAIANALNKEGVKPPRGNKFYETTIRQILSNTSYMGDSIRFKTINKKGKKTENKGEKQKLYFKNTHPPIVSESVFNAAQTLKGAIRKLPVKGEILFSQGGPLSKKLRCKECGSVFKPTSDGLWICPGYKDGCDFIILQESAIVAMAKKALELYNEVIIQNDESADIDEKLKKIEKKKETLTKKKLYGEMDEIECEELINKLNEEYIELATKQKSVKRRNGVEYNTDKMEELDILREIKVGIVARDKTIEFTLNNGFITPVKYPKLERSDYSWKL